MPLIAVVNKSTMVKDADVEVMCQAVSTQMKTMVAPAWQVQAPTITFYADASKVPGHAWLFTFIDTDRSVPGALGYHTLNQNGQVQAFIMCAPTLQNGGVVLYDPANPNNYAVSATFSHEAIEALLDRFCVEYAVNGTKLYAFEACDPCEDVNITVEVNGQKVFVSDFILPAYFNVENITGPYDYCKALKAPFSLTSGGYYVVGTSVSNLHQVFGRTMPDWKRATKQHPLSRGARRVGKPGLWKRFVAWLNSEV